MILRRIHADKLLFGKQPRPTLQQQDQDRKILVETMIAVSRTSSLQTARL